MGIAIAKSRKACLARLAFRIVAGKHTICAAGPFVWFRRGFFSCGAVIATCCVTRQRTTRTPPELLTGGLPDTVLCLGAIHGPILPCCSGRPERVRNPLRLHPTSRLRRRLANLWMHISSGCTYQGSLRQQSPNDASVCRYRGALFCALAGGLTNAGGFRCGTRFFAVRITPRSSRTRRSAPGGVVPRLSHSAISQMLILAGSSTGLCSIRGRLQVNAIPVNDGSGDASVAPARGRFRHPHQGLRDHSHETGPLLLSSPVPSKARYDG